MKNLLMITSMALLMFATTQAQEGEKSALILIETQNEWMHPDGKLRNILKPDDNLINTSVKNIEKALKYARENNIIIVYAGLTFDKGYPELANGQSGLRKTIPVNGVFQKGTFGVKFYETIKPKEGEFIVSGRVGASAFSGSNLDDFLRNNKIETIYLTGYATHVCVESTLRDGHDMGYNTYILSDATAAFNQSQQDYVMKEIVHHFGEHLTTEEFINREYSY